MNETLTTLTTLRDYMRWASSRFTAEKLSFGQGTTTALDEAVALVLYAANQPYHLSASFFDCVLTLEERKTVFELIERRINERIPAAYLTKESIFMGLPFYVDERVLIPRSPIAELIEQRFEPWIEEDSVENILDLCTGSACIAIACAYAFPNAIVDAVDLSPEALEVAEINIEKHQVGETVNTYYSDLFNKLPPTKYDIIISNPPYVCIEEYGMLPPEFHAEPDIAFKGGTSGLDLVLRILSNAKEYLSEQGILIVEVGSSAETLQNLLPDVPFYWLNFERGGDGVFLLTAEQIFDHQTLLKVTDMKGGVGSNSQ
jgi:ribosomal protein L3 glutamine methyltransferase